MKKLAIALALSLSFAGVAFAGGDAPGTPGDANCAGQTTAFLAQLGKNADVDGVRGIGGLAAAIGASVKEVKAAVDAFCNP